MAQQRLAHQRHHERLRNGLAVAEGQGRIDIGAAGECFVDQYLARGVPDHFEYRGIVYAASLQAPYQAVARALRGHANAAMLLIHRSPSPFIHPLTTSSSLY